MSVCRLRSAFLALCVLELILTAERQVFDFLGYMWTPILANFLNVLFLIFGCFGAVQRVPTYLLAYTTWSLLWLGWNSFLVCFFLNVGTLRRESDLLSLGTGSVSWWEGNGWGCRPVWGAGDASDDAGGAWLRPARVDGCLLPWPRAELAQAAVSIVVTASALAPGVVLAVRANKRATPNEKENASRRPIYTIELSPAETATCESSLKPMTPRRVKRRSGSRSNQSSVRRSRRSYRNAGYHASTASLPRDPRTTRPASAHSSYSNFHGARPASYHAPETRSHELEPPPEPTGYEGTLRGPASPGYDVVGPYEPKRGYEASGYDTTGRSHEVATPSYDVAPRMDVQVCEPAPYGPVHYGPPGGYMPVESGGWEAPPGGWEAPPPPAPPYCARATPQAPGPPAYQASAEGYM